MSFLRSFPFSGLGSKAEGDTAGGVDMTEGDLVNRSDPNTKFILSLPFWENLDSREDAEGDSRCDKSSLLGFFLCIVGGLGAGRGQVMSSTSAALPGNPLAMAELDVCWDIERGSFDLS